ncbi:MAG: spore coat protein [Sporomusaceae bacterium]|nr:spore coat protein [Sporomusaceae bacterium]
MPLQLSQKETFLLQDQIAHENLCIEKYQKGSQTAHDPQLKQLFQSYEQQERQHLNTLNSIMSGQVPSMNQKQQGQQNQSQQQQPPAAGQQGSGGQTAAFDQVDATLCRDMLMAEKYVSGAYNTAIFEFADPAIRQALNHIQKEEQEHGEGIFNYMNSHGMYNVQ